MKPLTSSAALAAVYLRKYKGDGQATVCEQSDVKMKLAKWERLNRLLENHQKGIRNLQMAAAKC